MCELGALLKTTAPLQPTEKELSGTGGGGGWFKNHIFYILGEIWRKNQRLAGVSLWALW
jgi:hypothetical protein